MQPGLHAGREAAGGAERAALQLGMIFLAAAMPATFFISRERPGGVGHHHLSPRRPHAPQGARPAAGGAGGIRGGMHLTFYLAAFSHFILD